MRTRKIALVVSILASVAVIGLLLSAGNSIPPSESVPPRTLAVQVLGVQLEEAPPPTFLEDEASSRNVLLIVRVHLKGIQSRMHPADFVVDRVNGGMTRGELMSKGASPTGQLWDYTVTDANGTRVEAQRFPVQGPCFLLLRFVVPMAFKTGVLELQRRSMAKLSL